jgi:hypothetical protein
MCGGVLFYLEWRVAANGGWMVTDDRLIFFPSFFSLDK